MPTESKVEFYSWTITVTKHVPSHVLYFYLLRFTDGNPVNIK